MIRHCLKDVSFTKRILIHVSSPFDYNHPLATAMPDTKTTITITIARHSTRFPSDLGTSAVLFFALVADEADDESVKLWVFIDGDDDDVDVVGVVVVGDVVVGGVDFVANFANDATAVVFVVVDVGGEDKAFEGIMSGDDA